MPVCGVGMKTPRQLALQARVRFEVSVVDRGEVRYSFVTVGHRREKRFAQLKAAQIARAQFPGSRIYVTRRPFGDAA